MTTLVLAETQALFRSALRSALALTGDVDVVAEAADRASTLTAIELHEPDALLLDTKMHDHRCILQSVRGRQLRTRVIVLAPSSDSYLLMQSLEAGAHGFLSKEQPLSALVHATRVVLRGETFVPPGMLGGLLHDLIERRRIERDQATRLERLTKRERQVLDLLVAGYDHESLAAHLVISPPTARSHIQNLLRKLEVHSRLEAVALVTGGAPATASMLERLNR